MVFKSDLIKLTEEAGFVSTGVTTPDMLKGLPYGWVGTIADLHTPEAELPTVKSVILLGYYAWDKSMNLQVDSAYFLQREKQKPEVPLENYQLYYEILKNKAWRIVDYLRRKGFESRYSLSIPLKTSAVKCGLGCQGKNTLLVTPIHGPRVRLISVLTEAEFDADEPYKDDLCKGCKRCVTACPTKALEPYKINIPRCMTYAAEKPDASDVPKGVRELEQKLIQRPTLHSYLECSICIEACPIGKHR